MCLSLLCTLAACTGSGGSAVTGSQGGSDPAGGHGASGAAGGQGGSGAAAGEGGQGGSGASGGAGGGTAGGGAGFVPDPIPVIDEEPPPPCQAAIDDPYYFQFLDDVCKAKKLPTAQDRDRACPSIDLSPDIQLQDGTVVTYAPSSAPVEVDDSALKGIVPDAMDVTVILIRRVNGVPHYRYLSNGTHDIPYQPWSTTKVLAAANAAATLRIQSDYKVGLTADAGGTPLGDLVTSVCNYDDDPYSSNSLGRYFHDIGGRKKANDLMHGLWLGRPAAETFGGNYGAPSPPLGYNFTESNGDSVTIAPDMTSGPANYLSSFTTAEAVKRLVLHREEPDQRLPGIQWKDIRVLLYGAEGSAKYGPWGGMTQDTAIYLQTGHDIDYIESRSHGQWTLFSKLGLGSQGQFLDIGYACFPVLDDADNPVPGWSREFVISAHLPTGGATWKERDRLLAKTYRAIVTRILDGRL
jgi:hypothetical protein